ncbi:tRNA (guanosine(37)-N1)-methyltransferase TrmD [Candidatus Calescamantes bacterium]|nr:tRNA (guanosine(37)-N1)-methyltransferase TrmD [Candidatus Calescamantes bacterium]
MRIDVVTIFPELFEPFFESGLLGKSIREGKIEVQAHDLRTFTRDKHRQVDDYPFGGGRGMILMIEPLYRAWETLKQDNTFTILMSAGGKLLTKTRAARFSRHDHLLIFCGRYEGVDQRFLDCVDAEVSIGKYVLFGGEIPAMTLIESAARFIPEILDPEVTANETYSKGSQRDFPQFTRPREFGGISVPSVLLSGNHAKIDKWREENSERI